MQEIKCMLCISDIMCASMDGISVNCMMIWSSLSSCSQSHSTWAVHCLLKMQILFSSQSGVTDWSGNGKGKFSQDLVDGKEQLGGYEGCLSEHQRKQCLVLVFPWRGSFKIILLDVFLSVFHVCKHFLCVYKGCDLVDFGREDVFQFRVCKMYFD